MLRRTSTPGRREAQRNCSCWHELPAELVVEVARALDARSLCACTRVCQPWRLALEAASTLWEALLRAQFPRAMALVTLLPTDQPFKDIYREQLAAERPKARVNPPPICTLSDFAITFELIKQDRMLPLPAPPKNAVRLFQLSDHPQAANHPDTLPHLNQATQQAWRLLPVATRADFERQAVDDKARFRAQYEKYEAAAAKGELVRSWTGDLSPMLTDDASFTLPLNWADWQKNWESEDAFPMRLRVLASRITAGQMRTRLLGTTSPSPDGAQDVSMDMFMCLRTCDAFDGDDYAFVPEMHLEFERGGISDDLAMWEPYPWNHAEIGVSFQMYQPDADTDPMTRDQLLRYLEYCVPW